MFRNNKKFILALGLATAMTSCGSKKAADEGVGDSLPDSRVHMNESQMKSAAIQTSGLEEKEISSVLKVNGQVDVPPQNMVSVSVPLGGYLRKTQLLPGMKVNKGEIIATVEDQQYLQLQQDYLMAKARINFLEQEYKRQQELNKTQASSDKVYQQAESDYRSARTLITALAAKLELAGIAPGNLSETTIQKQVFIHSPITGYVSKVNVNTGRYISPTEVLFELVNPTDIHLSLKVYEKDLAAIIPGQKVIAYTNFDPQKKYPCEVLLTGHDISPERNTEIHCHFLQYDDKLLPGTFMNAEIELKYTRRRVLPDEAIVRYLGKQFIFREIEKGYFEMTEVKVGEANGGYSEILFSDNKPHEGEKYVTKGAYSVLMMMENRAD